MTCRCTYYLFDEIWDKIVFSLKLLNTQQLWCLEPEPTWLEHVVLCYLQDIFSFGGETSRMGHFRDKDAFLEILYLAARVPGVVRRLEIALVCYLQVIDFFC